MKQFSHYKMSSEYDGSKLISGFFYSDENATEIADGSIVVVGDLINHNVFGTMKDMDNRKITAPTANTDSVAVVDYVGVAEGTIAGNLYRQGIKTAGLTCPANRPTRVRVLSVGDTFYTASGNFASAPTEGQYAIPTANGTVWTPVTSAATDKVCIKIEASKPLTQGQVNADTLYFCRVVKTV